MTIKATFIEVPVAITDLMRKAIAADMDVEYATDHVVLMALQTKIHRYLADVTQQYVEEQDAQEAARGTVSRG